MRIMRSLPNEEFDIRDPRSYRSKAIANAVGKSIIIATSTGSAVVTLAFLSGMVFGRWQGVEKIVWFFQEITKLAA